MAMFKVVCYLVLKNSLFGLFISKSINLFEYLLEDEVGLENRNSIRCKRKREAQTTDVISCDKDVERQARNREYQRNYRAQLRGKADGNQKEHPDPSVTIVKQPGSTTTTTTTTTKPLSPKQVGVG